MSECSRLRSFEGRQETVGRCSDVRPRVIIKGPRDSPYSAFNGLEPEKWRLNLPFDILLILLIQPTQDSCSPGSSGSPLAGG